VLEIVDVYLRRNAVIHEHLTAIRQRGWPEPAWLGVDPAGRQRSDQTGESTVDVLRRAGLRIRAARSPVAEGLELIRRRLEPLTPGEPDSPPGLVIHPRCRKLIDAMVRYHFDPRRPDSAAPVKDGPDHPVDALRYLVTNAARGNGQVGVRGY